MIGAALLLLALGVGEVRTAEAESLDPCEREEARLGPLESLTVSGTVWIGSDYDPMPDQPSGFVVVRAEHATSGWEKRWTTFERLDAALCHAQGIADRPYYVPRQELLGVYELKRIPTATKEVPSTREVVVVDPQVKP